MRSRKENKHGNKKRRKTERRKRFPAAFVLIVCHYLKIDRNLNAFEQIFDDLIYVSGNIRNDYVALLPYKLFSKNISYFDQKLDYFCGYF